MKPPYQNWLYVKGPITYLDCCMILARRIAQLVIGLVLYGIALALMVRAGIGVAPWDVLSQGLVKQTGISFGWMTNIVGAFVLLLWIPIKQKPGIGTIVNVLLIGPSAELGLLLVPQQENLWVRIPLFAGGLVLLAIATGLYIGARMGPGPRDGLMTGANKRFGWPIWIVRTVIELSVLTIGWLLGGNLGLGTLAFALLIGPMVGVTLPLLRVPEAATAHADSVVPEAPLAPAEHPRRADEASDRREHPAI
jgi:uncharacterized membrane protein YczE